MNETYSSRVYFTDTHLSVGDTLVCGFHEGGIGIAAEPLLIYSEYVYRSTVSRERSVQSLDLIFPEEK